jgi:hypothetical protein
MGIRRFRINEKDDGYTNIGVICSELRKNGIVKSIKKDHVFKGISIDDTDSSDITNRRIAIVDYDHD